MTRRPPKPEHLTYGEYGEMLEDERLSDQAFAKKRDELRAQKVREGRTYRFARRNGWRVLNQMLVKNGGEPVSWSTFNQYGHFEIGTRPTVYRQARLPSRGKTWEKAFHHGEKKRRYRQAYGALPEGMTA